VLPIHQAQILTVAALQRSSGLLINLNPETITRH